MRRVNKGDLDRLCYKSGGGCLTIFGLPFLLAGLFTLYTAIIGNVKVKGGGTAGVGTLIGMAFFSLPFIAIGAGLVLGRSGMVLERTARTVTTWWGLIFPFKSVVRSLSEFSMITVTRERRQSKNGSYDVYPVRLTAKSGKDLDVDTASREQDARSLAEEVARFIDFGIHDSSGGNLVVREAGKLDESLREQVVRKKQDVVIGAPPPVMLSTYSAEGDRVTFVIPPEKFSITALIPFGCASMCWLIWYGTVAWRGSSSAAERSVFIWIVAAIFVGLPILGLISSFIKQRTSGCTVDASPDELRIRLNGMFFDRTFRISSDKLEELRLETDRRRNLTTRMVLVAISDEDFVRFGRGLSGEELDWIRSVIMKAVTK